MAGFGKRSKGLGNKKIGVSPHQEGDAFFKNSTGNFFEGLLGSALDIGKNVLIGAERQFEGIADNVQYGVADIIDVFSKGNEVSKGLRNNAKANSTDMLFGLNNETSVFELLGDTAKYKLADSFKGINNDVSKILEKSAYLQDDIKNVNNYIDNASIFGNKSDAILQGVGQVGANALISTVTGNSKLINSLTTFMASSGNARSEAYKNGADDKTAFLSGLVSGASETISENIFDGLPFVKSAGIGDFVTSKIGKSVENYLGKGAGKLAVKLMGYAGEGVEEMFANAFATLGNDIVNAFDKKYTNGVGEYDENILVDTFKSFFSNEAFDNAVSGTLTAILTGGANTYLNKHSKNRVINEYAKENNMTVSEAKKILERHANAMKKGVLSDNDLSYKQEVELDDVVDHNIKNNLDNIKTYEENIKNIENKEKITDSYYNPKYQEYSFNETDDDIKNEINLSLKEAGASNSRSVHELSEDLTKLSKKLNIKIKASNSEIISKELKNIQKSEIDDIGGYVHNNNGVKEIVINLNSNQATNYIIGHELTHVFEKNKNLYLELRNLVYDYAKEKGIYDEINKTIKDIYQDNSIQDSELTATLTGKLINDNNLIKKLVNSNQATLFIEKIKGLYNEATGNVEKARLNNIVEVLEKNYLSKEKNKEDDIKFFKVGYNQKGYYGQSMSIRAKEAYEDGEKPISKFTLEDLKKFNEVLQSKNISPIKSLNDFKKILKKHGKSSWHHTSLYANETNFYQPYYMLEELEEEYTNEEIENIFSNITQTKGFSKKIKEIQKKYKNDEDYDLVYRVNIKDFDKKAKLYERLKNSFEIKAKLEKDNTIKISFEDWSDFLFKDIDEMKENIGEKLTDYFLKGIARQVASEGKHRYYSYLHQNTHIIKTNLANILSYENSSEKAKKLLDKLDYINNGGGFYEYLNTLEKPKVTKINKDNENYEIKYYFLDKNKDNILFIIDGGYERPKTIGYLTKKGDSYYDDDNNKVDVSDNILNRKTKMYSTLERVYSFDEKAEGTKWFDEIKFEYEKNNKLSDWIENGTKVYSADFPDYDFATYDDERNVREIIAYNDTYNIRSFLIYDDYKNKDKVKLVEEDITQFSKSNNELNELLNKKESKFYENVTEKANFISEENKEKLSKEDFYFYKGVTNEESLSEAQKNLEKENEYGNWIVRMKNNPTNVDIAEGWILIKHFQDNEDYETMSNVVEVMREAGTKLGQAVQTFGILQRLTPEGMTYYAQKELTKMFNEVSKDKPLEWKQKYTDDFKLTPEEMKFIKETMGKVQEADDERTKKINLALIQKMIENKIPPKLTKQIKGYMRLSMLFNFKTQVRNILGNGLIVPVNLLADTVASGFDKSISKKTGIRTTGTYDLKAYFDGMKQGAKESTEDFKLNINTKDISLDRFEFRKGITFDPKTKIGKTLNNLERILNYVMDFGDRVFFQGEYNKSIANQLKLNNTKEVTEDMIDIAINEALERTWNDNNRFTKAVLGLRRGLNEVFGDDELGVGDMLLFFAKTPANLIRATYKYSPMPLPEMLVRGIKINNKIKNGTLTSVEQHKYVQDMGKMFAGTFIYLLGFILANANILSGKSDEDKDTADFMKNTLGISSYSIKIGDKSYTYDWAQPVASGLATTANIVHSKDKFGSVFESIIGSLDTAGSIMMEQSFLQTFNKVFNNKEGLATGFIEQTLETPLIFIPAIIKQMTDVLDDTKRQTYIKGKPIETTINKIKNKTPFLSKELAPSINAMGEINKKYGGNSNFIETIFNSMFSPANINKETLNVASKEIFDIYENSGNKNLLPRVAPYSLKIGDKTIILTNNQRAEFSKISGQYISNEIKKLKSSIVYNKLDNDEKSEILTDISNYAYNLAKNSVLGIPVSKTYKTPHIYAKLGNLGEYFTLSLEIENINNHYQSMIKENMSNFQKKHIYEGKRKATINYINKLKMDKNLKLITYKLLGGYSIKGNEKAIYDYLSKTKLSKEEKKMIFNRLFK